MNYFVSPTKTASVSQQINGIYVGKISRVVDNEVFVEVPSIINGFSFGPAIVTNFDALPVVNDIVVCGFLNNSLDEITVIGKLANFASASELSSPLEPWATGAKSTQATGLGDIISDPGSTSYWGQRLALSGDGTRMVVGATLYDVSPLSNNGLVRVLEWDGSDWNQIGDDFNGLVGNAQLGRAVAISQNGNVIVAATPNPSSGAGYVLAADYVDGSWVSRTVLTGASSSSFGNSVGLSADGMRIVIGSPGNDTVGGNAGAVHVYDWDGSTWTQVGSTIFGETAGDDFGTDVSISNDGTRIAVGAPDWNTGQGRVYVYEYSGGSWSLKGSELEGYAAGAESMGTSVAISGDGNWVIGGEPDHSSSTGSIRVWEWSATSADWVVAQYIDGSAASDRFGFDVSISSDGQRIAVAAYGNDDNGSSAGVIRVYDWNGAKFNQVGGDFFRWPGDNYGNNVDMSADGRVVAGGTYLDPFFIKAFAFV